MPAPLTFRPASPVDRTDLMALQWRASLGNPRDREAVLTRADAINISPEQLTAEQAVVAVLNGVDVGFALVLPFKDGAAELEGLFVDPGHWTLGIGRALCDEAQELARAMGATHLRVVANPEAVGFYADIGFESVGTTQTDFGPAPLMQLTL